MKTNVREDLVEWRDDARRAAIKRQHDAHERSCARILHDLAACAKAAEEKAATAGRPAPKGLNPLGS